jgi:hypothetical protein
LNQNLFFVPFRDKVDAPVTPEPASLLDDIPLVAEYLAYEHLEFAPRHLAKSRDVPGMVNRGGSIALAFPGN